MWKVKRPTNQAGPTFMTCISRVKNADLKRRLEQIEPNIIQAETEYIYAAETSSLNTVAPTDTVADVVTNDEMVKVYDNRMVKANSPGRIIYDELINAASHSRCPFCGHLPVSTLDHVLPKRLYSTLTVTPVNLVPSCGDCNKAKSSATPASSEEVFLHPYFDDIETDRWLYAAVKEQKPASLYFYVSAPGGWNNTLRERVQNHFDTLNIDRLYRSQSAEELINIRHQLGMIFDAGGEAAVRNHLQDAAETRITAHLNSWRSATYEALALSNWFCNEGFR